MEGQSKAGSHPSGIEGMAAAPTGHHTSARAAEPLLFLPPGAGDSDSICTNLLFDSSNSQPWSHISTTGQVFKIPDAQAQNQAS